MPNHCWWYVCPLFASYSFSLLFLNITAEFFTARKSSGSPMIVLIILLFELFDCHDPLWHSVASAEERKSADRTRPFSVVNCSVSCQSSWTSSWIDFVLHVFKGENPLASMTWGAQKCVAGFLLVCEESCDSHRYSDESVRWSLQFAVFLSW